MPIKAEDVICTFEGGQEPKETYKKVFEEIGNHFINNADRFTEQIVDEHRGMKIEIDIPINDIVNISMKFDEYVIIKKDRVIK